MPDSTTNFSPNPAQRPTLTSRQQSVADALAQRQTKKYPLAKWYLGAIRVLDDELNPDGTAQAAHSLRELLEKLPLVLQGEAIFAPTNYKQLRAAIRDNLRMEDAAYPNCTWEGKAVGANLASALDRLVAYLEINAKPDRVESVASSIASLDPMFYSLSPEISRQKANQYQSVWLGIQEAAHHGSAETDVQVCIERIEDFILEVVAPVAESDRQEILAMLAKGPGVPGAAKLMRSLVAKRGANFVFFFQKVEDPGWLEHIEAAGLFASPPEGEREDELRTRWSYWWPVTILPKLVAKSELQVVRIASELPSTDNPQVLHEIAQVARMAPTIAHSLKLAPRVHEYINARLPWQAWDVGDELVKKWSVEGRDEAIEAALSLARSLLALEVVKPGEDRSSARVHGGFRMRCEPVQYRQLIDGSLAELMRVAPVKVAGMLASKVRKILRHENEIESGQPMPWRDQSSYWCFDVSHAGIHESDGRDLLVTALTAAGKLAVSADPSNAPEMASLLRRQPSQLFSRVLWSICADHPAPLKTVIVDEITGAQSYGHEAYDAEFYDMVRAAYKEFGPNLLSETQRTSIFERILVGPDREQYERFHGPEDAAKFWESFSRKFRLQQLAPFAAVLFGGFAKAFADLSDNGRNVPAAESYRRSFEGRGGTVEQRSPKTIEELAAMDEDALVAFLNSWDAVGLENNDFLLEISFRGLSNAFASVVEREPARFATWGARWKMLSRPIYVRAALQAAEKLVRAGRHDEVPAWLEICAHVTKQPATAADDGDMNADENPKWGSVRRGVCDFLEAAVDPKQPVSKEHKGAVWRLVEALVTGGDPDLEKANDAGPGFGGPYTVAINRTRSRAIEVALDTAAWSGDTSVLHQLLLARFNGQPALTLPERALLAVNFPRIMALDETWATVNAASFFPHKPSIEWLALITEYLVYTQAYTGLWPIIKGELDHALKNLPALVSTGSGHHRDQVASLGQHLLVYYLFGLTPLEGTNSLLQSFLRQAGTKKRAELFGHVGHLLYHAKAVSEDVLRRIDAYFDNRIAARDSEELDNFTLWLGAKCLTPRWRLEAYLRLLGKPQGNLSSYSEVGTLADLVSEEPALVMVCFAKITAIAHRQKHFYLKKEDVQNILRVGLASQNVETRQNAEMARDDLIKMGRQDYLEGL